MSMWTRVNIWFLNMFDHIWTWIHITMPYVCINCGILPLAAKTNFIREIVASEALKKLYTSTHTELHMTIFMPVLARPGWCRFLVPQDQFG